MNNVISTSSDKTTGSYHSTDVIYVVDTSANNVTITLEDAGDHVGQRYIVKHGTAGNTLTLATTNAQLIDAASTWTSTTVNEFVDVISTGSAWKVIAETGTAGGATVDALTLSGTDVVTSSSGTDKEGNSSHLLTIDNIAGTEVLQLSSYFNSSDALHYQYMPCPSGQYAQYSRFLSNDFSGGNDHRSLFEILQVDKGAANRVLYQLEMWTDVSGTTGGSMYSDCRVTGTTSQYTFDLNENNTSSNTSKYEMYGQDTAELVFSDARFVWKKGTTDLAAIAGDGTFGAVTLLASGDAGGIASSNAITGVTDTPTSAYNWDGTGTAPDGYIKAYVGTQAVVIPYWNT